MAQQSKVSGRHTAIHGGDGITIVTYHWTDVVIFDHEQISLNSNGWRTATTKTRMNQASNQFELGYRVYQKDYDWFVQLPDKSVVPFGDEMVIDRKTGGLAL